MCTLTISLLIGLVAPGAELTPQIYARGAPTLLDLGVAVASAAAAAYALARPNLVGSIAGVAIATALVPPLCSVGLSLAYGDRTFLDTKIGIVTHGEPAWQAGLRPGDRIVSIGDAPVRGDR